MIGRGSRNRRYICTTCDRRVSTCIASDGIVEKGLDVLNNSIKLSTKNRAGFNALTPAR